MIFQLIVSCAPVSAQGTQTITLYVEITGALEVKGWSLAISFEPDQASYISDSFEITEFMPGLVPLVIERESSVEVGGALLNSSPVSVTGTLGQLQFAITEQFTSVKIGVIEYAVSREGVSDQRKSVGSVVTLYYEPLKGDFTDDGVVDFSDFFLFADAFGSSEVRYDIYPDSIVDFSDFFLFADSFGKRSQVIGRINISAAYLTEMQEVTISGTTDGGVSNTVDVVGTIITEDTIHVEVIGTIQD